MEVKLKPGDDSADFVNKFNELDMGVVAALDLDHKTGLYGLVFFEGTLIKIEKQKELGWFRNQLRRFILWLES